MDEYISREKVVKEIKSRIFDADDAWENGYNTAMEGIMEWIEHMPSADGQPVKHGRWIRSDDQCWLTCPFCDTDVDVSCGAPFFYVDNDEVSHINFCPNCGARMDGDNNG